MRAILFGATLGAVFLTGCAPGTVAPGASPNCEALMRRVDVAVRTAQTYGGQDDMAVRSAVGWRRQDLRRAGCASAMADRAGPEAIASIQRAGSVAPYPRFL